MQKPLRSTDPKFGALLEKALRKRQGRAAGVTSVVQEIVQHVRDNGDPALLRYTEQFDGIRLESRELRVSRKEIEIAFASCEREDIAALEFAAGRIEDFHKRQIPREVSFTDQAGLKLATRWTPIQSVGLYVPGGQAVYPSSLLMNAIPARLAGVERLAMVVPCPGGTLSPYLLAAAKIVGVEEIYKVGGAQAIAGLAYGTKTICPVDKIVGPGNAFVAEAKRQVFGIVGIDAIAGPSEILIVADREADPSWIAMDLLSQAEHDKDAVCTLITDDLSFAGAVEQNILDHLTRLERADIARESWEKNGITIVMDDLLESAILINRLAPEHVEVALENPDPLLKRIKNAGAIFIGRYTPEAVGDYVAGPNHVLPTARSARYSSGLSVVDFCKSTNLIECDASSLRAVAEHGITLAKREGLEAHAKSLAIRLADE